MKDIASLKLVLSVVLDCPENVAGTEKGLFAVLCGIGPVLSLRQAGEVSVFQ